MRLANPKGKLFENLHGTEHGHRIIDRSRRPFAEIAVFAGGIIVG
jgi:hypothetical protein